ncbi:MAG TPA: uracil-DNA glycosylase [Candidatus Kapabacteria bacterium]|nr:uracil-DNA glycosylase [Candidatus Kapabacteria bacterium]
MNENLTYIERLNSYLKQYRQIYGDTIYIDKTILLSCNIHKEKTNDFSDKKQEVFAENENILINDLDLFENEDTLKECKSLGEFKHLISGCQKCPLGATRKNFVFGSGNPNADLMIIGEAPGADEDLQGEPFVGRAGQLLTNILNAIKFDRKDVFIANILKCRPPENRRPLPTEVKECLPYLEQQIKLVKPKYILILGLTAANSLLNNTLQMGEIRGKLFEYQGIKTMVTYHPSALLRNPNWKPFVWKDVQLLRKMYDEEINC